MAKLKIEDKKEIIRLHIDCGIGVAELSKLFHINETNTRELIRKFQFHGDVIFVKEYRIFSPDIKLEVINKYRTGESKRSLSIQYNIKLPMINSWLIRYEENGYNGLIDKPKGRPPAMKKQLSIDKESDPKDREIRELKQRNLELEAEVEALKKLRALVQQRNAQQQKKKQ